MQQYPNQLGMPPGYPVGPPSQDFPNQSQMGMPPQMGIGMPPQMGMPPQYYPQPYYDPMQMQMPPPQYMDDYNQQLYSGYGMQDPQDQMKLGLPLLNANVIKTAADKKTKDLMKKQKEEKILETLEKQTELLFEIANKYKRRAEEEERGYLQKIRKLEREKQELLLLNRNEEIINERVAKKLQQLKRLGFFVNPYAATSDPFYFPSDQMNALGGGSGSSDSEDDYSSEEEKKPKKKKKKKTKGKK